MEVFIKSVLISQEAVILMASKMLELEERIEKLERKRFKRALLGRS